MTQLEQRMYGLVPYNISPIQQGIQFGHGVVEYGLKYGHFDDYQEWAKNDKTFIILNGGTTNVNQNNLGSLNFAATEIHSMDIPYATFYEPDLGDQLTAVVFLVDERVWNKEKYPPYDDVIHEVGETSYYDNLFGKESDKILEFRNFLSKFKLA